MRTDLWIVDSSYITSYKTLILITIRSPNLNYVLLAKNRDIFYIFQIITKLLRTSLVYVLNNVSQRMNEWMNECRASSDNAFVGVFV